MVRMCMNEHGERVPITDLMSQEDLEKYNAKLAARGKKAEEVQKKIDKKAKEKVLKPLFQVDEVKVPEGTVACHKMDVECGLRKEHYCTMAPGQMCDHELEIADIASGTERASVRPRSDKPIEIDDSPLPVYKEKSASEIKAQQKAYAERFDKFSATELKAKCKKLKIPVPGNASKKLLIQTLRTEMGDFGTPEEEKSSDKL